MATSTAVSVEMVTGTVTDQFTRPPVQATRTFARGPIVTLGGKLALTYLRDLSGAGGTEMMPAILASGGVRTSPSHTAIPRSV